MKPHPYGGLREGTDSIYLETLLFYITYFDLCLIRILPHDVTFETLADTELCRLSLGMMYWIGNIHEGRYSATICISVVITVVRQTMARASYSLSSIRQASPSLKA